MVELGAYKRDIIYDMCKDSAEVVVVSAALGYTGRVWVPSLDNPYFCVIKTQDYVYPVGMPPKGATAIDLRSILIMECENCYIVPPDDLWSQWLDNHLDCDYRTLTRYATKKGAEHFDMKLLDDYIEELPKEYHIKRIDAYTYKRIQKSDWCTCFIDSYQDADDFVDHAIGYVVQKGREIVSGCSCFAHTDDKTDITIKTKEGYRRQKLARAVAATYIKDQLSEGKYPNWDAANQNSVALAEKLGYVFDTEYIAYQIQA